MRVLVADDEPRLLDSIKDFLGAEGIDVGTAPDGSAARSLVSEEAWDAAVLDIRMPGMDGLA
ncbi:MAG TPA: response regulator, partial [Spirochaetales bacterium]|nr:response regulator [Spirochaetales bacterium]